MILTMIDLESLWRDAKPEAQVCSVTGTTKNMVLAAVMNGARSFEEISAAAPLCGGECAMQNISGRGCRENAEALLSVYLPVFEMMTEGGGCSHHGHNADKK